MIWMRDVERYRSPSRFEAEKRVVFRRLPLVVGRESDLPEPGRFFTHDASGMPLLMTRDRAGAVHAMHNECTHRGTRLVSEERGSAESFVCKFHAWRFELGGQLARPGRASLPRALEQFVDDRALLALPCEARHGFLWVVPTARTRIDVAASLGSSTDGALASLGLTDLVEVRREIETRPGNWKELTEALLDRARPGEVLPVFPSSALVIDASGVSLLSVFPESVDASTCVHTRLARRLPEIDAEHAASDEAWRHAGEALAPLPEREGDEAEDPERIERRRAFNAAVDHLVAAHPVASWRPPLP
jgi:nitrite reductase/ring-hydroxylating ferredoxin subunit